MNRRIVLVTGATDGLGKALALRFAASGARVIVHGRCAQRCRDTIEAIGTATGNPHLESCVADFSRMKDVFAMIEAIRRRHDRLDLLVNNAGLGVEEARADSHDGYENVLQVNYLATYALSLGLADRVAACGGRIVCVSSLSQAPVDFDDPHYCRGWEGPQAYGRSKWAQVAFCAGFASVIAGSGASIHSLHPGSFMPTKLVVGKWPVDDALEVGVEAVWHVAHHASPAAINGAYFDRSTPARALESAYDPQVQLRLLDLSQALVAAVPGSAVVPAWHDCMADSAELAVEAG